MKYLALAVLLAACSGSGPAPTGHNQGPAKATKAARPKPATPKVAAAGEPVEEVAAVEPVRGPMDPTGPPKCEGGVGLNGQPRRLWERTEETIKMRWTLVMKAVERDQIAVPRFIDERTAQVYLEKAAAKMPAEDVLLLLNAIYGTYFDGCDNHAMVRVSDIESGDRVGSYWNTGFVPVD